MVESKQLAKKEYKEKEKIKKVRTYVRSVSALIGVRSIYYICTEYIVCTVYTPSYCMTCLRRCAVAPPLCFLVGHMHSLLFAWWGNSVNQSVVLSFCVY